MAPILGPVWDRLYRSWAEEDAERNETLAEDALGPRTFSMMNDLRGLEDGEDEEMVDTESLSTQEEESMDTQAETLATQEKALDTEAAETMVTEGPSQEKIPRQTKRKRRLAKPKYP